MVLCGPESRNRTFLQGDIVSALYEEYREELAVLLHRVGVISLPPLRLDLTRAEQYAGMQQLLSACAMCMRSVQCFSGITGTALLPISQDARLLMEPLCHLHGRPCIRDVREHEPTTVIAITDMLVNSRWQQPIMHEAIVRGYTIAGIVALLDARDDRFSKYCVASVFTPIALLDIYERRQVTYRQKAA